MSRRWCRWHAVSMMYLHLTVPIQFPVWVWSQESEWGYRTWLPCREASTKEKSNFRDSIFTLYHHWKKAAVGGIVTTSLKERLNINHTHPDQMGLTMLNLRRLKSCLERQHWVGGSISRMTWTSSFLREVLREVVRQKESFFLHFFTNRFWLWFLCTI